MPIISSVANSLERPALPTRVPELRNDDRNDDRVRNIGKFQPERLSTLTDRLERDVRARPLIRAATVFATAASNRTKSVDEVLRERYRGDKAVQLLTRAAVTPTVLAGSPFAATAVVDFVASLSGAASMLLKLGLQLSFDQNAGILVPGVSVAAWIAEGNVIPVKQFVTSGAMLVPRSLKVICLDARNGRGFERRGVHQRCIVPIHDPRTRCRVAR